MTRLTDPNESFTPARRKATTRWFSIVLIVLVTSFIVVIYERNRIRAFWWTHQLINTNDVSSRAYFLAALCSVGEDAIIAIEDLSEADDPEVRALAVYAFQSMSDEVAIKGLGRLLGDPDVDVRESSALAMAFLQSSEATQKLCDATKSTDVRAATAAIAALGRLGIPMAMDAMCDALAHHRSPLVRAQAAESMTVLLTGALGQSDSLFNSHGCDPFQCLIQAAADQALFAGRLALEREIASADRFAGAHGSLAATPMPTTHAAPSKRSVAEIAVNCLSVLTGRTVTRQTILEAADPGAFADQCRERYRPHCYPHTQKVEKPTSQMANPSDTNTDYEM